MLTLQPKTAEQRKEYADFKRRKQQLPALLICLVQLSMAVITLLQGNSGGDLSGTWFKEIFCTGTLLMWAIFLLTQSRHVPYWVMDLLPLVFCFTNFLACFMYIRSRSQAVSHFLP